MNRRTALAITASSVGTVISGCLGSKRDDDFADPAADPFPIAVENAERGGAETFATQTIESGREYEDASMGCANEAYTAVREHLEGEIDDTSHIGIGRGRAPEGFDGIAITVSLTTAIYDRDGTLVEEADLEFEELVAATPPTAYVQTEDGERICAVPVYVEQAEMHID